MRKPLSCLLLCIVAISAVRAQHAGAHSGNATGMTHSPAAMVPGSCVTNPTQANCTDFELPVAIAAADLVTLCKAMPFMVACSVANACNQTGAGPMNATSAAAANVSAQDPHVCHPFQLVATVCRPKENMMKMKGCVNYNPMCANGTKVEQCTEMPGGEALPTTKLVNDRVRTICEAMPHTGCELCLPSWEKNQTWGDCDLLDVYGSVCSEMPDMVECAEFQEMCAQDETLWVCRKYPTALVAAAEGPAAGNATAAAAAPAAKATSSAAAANGNGLLLMLAAVLLVCLM